MRKHITALALLICSFAYSQQTSVSPHRIYFGPDIFGVRSEDRAIGIKAKVHGTLYGLRAGYDFLQPSAVYGGFQALYALGKTHTRATFYQMSKQASETTSLANLEGRMGYNIQAGRRALITPFFGLGWYRLHQSGAIAITQNWAYEAAGIRSNFTVNPHLDVGLNLKAMLIFFRSNHFNMGSRSFSHSKFDQNAWGYEVGVPFTWGIRTCNKWDIQFEPYFLKLDTKNNEDIFGARLTFGYRI